MSFCRLPVASSCFVLFQVSSTTPHHDLPLPSRPFSSFTLLVFATALDDGVCFTMIYTLSLTFNALPSLLLSNNEGYFADVMMGRAGVEQVFFYLSPSLLCSFSLNDFIPDPLLL